MKHVTQYFSTLYEILYFKELTDPEIFWFIFSPKKFLIQQYFSHSGPEIFLTMNSLYIYCAGHRSGCDLHHMQQVMTLICVSRTVTLLYP